MLYNYVSIIWWTCHQISFNQLYLTGFYGHQNYGHDTTPAKSYDGHKSCTCTEWVACNIVMHGILMIYISCMSCIKSYTYVILFALFTCCNKHAISQQQIIGNPMISTANGRPCLTTTLSTNSRPSHAWGKSMSPIWFVDVSTSMPTSTSCTITLLYHIIILAFLTWRGKKHCWIRLLSFSRSCNMYGHLQFMELHFMKFLFFLWLTSQVESINSMWTKTSETTRYK